MKAITILVNPAAGRGRGKRLLEKLRSRFSYLDDSHFLVTAGGGDEVRLTSRAIENGCSILLVVGGDGTCNKVANTLLDSRSGCAMAVIPAGTGNDFAKTLGVRDFTVEQIASLVETAESIAIDVGRANGHYFLNSCGFGFDASVLEASNRVRFLRGDTVYIYSALKQLFTYRGVEMSTGGGKRERILMAIVSNGRYLGGAFKIAPTASVTDGQLDINVFGDCGVLERARLFESAMKGTHLNRRPVTYNRAARITLQFSTPPAIEMDGELRHAATPQLEIECIPRALAVIAAPGALAT